MPAERMKTGHTYRLRPDPSDSFKKELMGYDLEVARDMEDDGRGGYFDVVYVRTFQDRSVGIFGVQVSPTFRDMKDLQEWWGVEKELIEMGRRQGERSALRATST